MGSAPEHYIERFILVFTKNEYRSVQVSAIYYTSYVLCVTQNVFNHEHEIFVFVR